MSARTDQMAADMLSEVATRVQMEAPFCTLLDSEKEFRVVMRCVLEVLLGQLHGGDDDGSGPVSWARGWEGPRG